MKRKDFIKLTGAALSLSSLRSYANNSVKTEEWYQFRGPQRNNISLEKGILQSWPKSGPKLNWTTSEIGIGYSGMTVKDGSLYTMGAFSNKEYLISVDTKTGKTSWKTEIGDLYENNFGNGPRGSVTIDNDRLYAISAKGNFVCLDTKGKVLWKQKMSDFGGAVPKWGFSTSPLIDAKKVIISCGGDKGIVLALDKMTGVKIWQSSDFVGEDAQYSSIQKINVHGKDMYLKFAIKQVAGLDCDTGKVIWKTHGIGNSAACATPIYSDAHVYLSQGYGGGSLCHKINKDFTTTEVYKNKILNNHHGGLVLLDGYIYGYDNRKGWTCQNLKTGEAKWQSKEADKGSITYCDGQLFAYTETNGEVIIFNPDPKDWNEKGRFTIPKVSSKRKTNRVWTHPIISSGTLYLRDQEYLFSYNIKA